ncbi:MAG: transposase [Melioribacter sp.]|nr:transposase [Melioribacter sp.]
MNKLNRHSIRLKEFDYSQPSWYYITICTYQMIPRFGEIRNEKMLLNDVGIIIDDEWNKTKLIRSNIDLDFYVIMPNHLHGIIIINESGRGVSQYAPTTDDMFHSPSHTLGAIIRGFKSSSTKRINIKLCTPNKPLWQRNYYERIIRNEKELYHIRNYIQQNILKWDMGKNIPANMDINLFS